jgi:hypothetical protein
MKKNEIRTDKEAPLTTPVDASVLEYYRASPEDHFKMRASSPKRQRFFFREREKAIAFSFSIKRNLYSSCSRIYSSIVKT